MTFFADLESEPDICLAATDSELTKYRRKKGQKRKSGKSKNLSKPNNPLSVEPEVTNNSLSDGNILAGNNLAKDRSFDWEASEIWKFGRRIGIIGKGNDEEIISKLQELAARDNLPKLA